MAEGGEVIQPTDEKMERNGDAKKVAAKSVEALNEAMGINTKNYVPGAADSARIKSVVERLARAKNAPNPPVTQGE